MHRQPPLKRIGSLALALSLLLCSTVYVATFEGVPAQTPIAAQAYKSHNVWKGDRIVLTFEDRPGPITSTALPPPGSQPVLHPFLTANARAPEGEDNLARILTQSKDAQDFILRLRETGYRITPAAGK